MTVLFVVLSIIAGWLVGFSVGQKVSAIAWVKYFEAHGWSVIDEEGKLQAPQKLYSDFWYKARKEEQTK